ncbi:hypothetical protein CBER1_07341 [Cercospora berteroae]|uniref:RING-type domain-containing protein n=1 Tax=Cercospora berteroae TaxID=357750 RepID=A0A2S6CL44_9PEZI|nr:hypothetical protein CBER1_07341 [Cercospora berteroae]
MTYLTRTQSASDVRFEDSCAICYQDDEVPFRTACGHIFCKPCSLRVFTDHEACPMCRCTQFDKTTTLRPFDVPEHEMDQFPIVDRLYIKGVSEGDRGQFEYFMTKTPASLTFKWHVMRWRAGKLDLSALQDRRPQRWVHPGYSHNRLAVLTAIHWIRPREGLHDSHGTRKSSWTEVGDLLIEGLRFYQGQMMPIQTFIECLRCFYKDNSTQNTESRFECSPDDDYPWPEYCNGFEKKRCFRQDFDCVLDFIALAAHRANAAWGFTDEFGHAADKAPAQSEDTSVPFWEIEDVGSLELEVGPDALADDMAVQSLTVASAR